jgi:hypothetical protein
MGKQSKTRFDRSLTRKGNLQDYLLRFGDHPWAEHFFKEHTDFILVAAVRDGYHDGEMVCIHNPSCVDYMRPKLKAFNTEFESDVDAAVNRFLRDLSANCPLRPPFDSVVFEFKAPGYTHYGALCFYVPSDNALLLHGVRIKPDRSNPKVDEIFLDSALGVVQLDDQFEFKSSAIRPVSDKEDSSPLITMAECVFTLALLNASNVGLVNHEPDPVVNAAYKLKFGRGLTHYKTLAIRTLNQRGYADPKDYQGLMPLHLRRGNFAHYTDAAPLFGKYTGTFWRPATLVGEEKRGIVVKDYKIGK